MYVAGYTSTPPIRFVDKYADQRTNNKQEQWKSSIGDAINTSDTVKISDQAKFLSDCFDTPPDLGEKMKPWYFPEALDENYKLAQDKALEVADHASQIGINLDFDEILTQVILFNGITNPSIKDISANAIDSNGNERTLHFQSVHRLLSHEDKEILKELHNYTEQKSIDSTTVSNLATKLSMDKGVAMDRWLKPPRLDENYLSLLMTNINDWYPTTEQKMDFNKLTNMLSHR